MCRICLYNTHRSVLDFRLPKWPTVVLESPVESSQRISRLRILFFLFFLFYRGSNTPNSSQDLPKRRRPRLPLPATVSACQRFSSNRWRSISVHQFIGRGCFRLAKYRRALANFTQWAANVSVWRRILFFFPAARRPIRIFQIGKANGKRGAPNGNFSNRRFPEQKKRQPKQRSKCKQEGATSKDWRRK